MKKQSFSLLYLVFLVLNITFLLISNIISSKMVLIFGMVFTAGDLLFPLTYILNDIFVEIYGYEKAKFTIIVSFLANLIMVLIFTFAVMMPYPSFYLNQDAFSLVLMFTPRILLASFLSYVIGSFINAKVMDKMKKRDERFLYRRTICSTVIGELIDTMIFITVSFYGTMNNAELLKLILNVYVLKVMIEILFTPITYLVINFLRKKESING